MATHSSLTPLAAEKQIRQLEEELYLAQSTVLEMAGPEAEKILRSPPTLRTRGEVYDWLKAAVERVIDLAVPLTSEERNDGFYHGNRAVCPLCGGSSRDRYRPTNGYAYPEGLRWHLLGDRGSPQCKVAHVALDHALHRAANPLDIR